MQPLFQLDGIDVPFDEESDLWMRAIYEESGCKLDFVSAGSGFLQVVNLLTFLFRSPTGVALLDEPDSHMHEDLLRLAFELLDRLSSKRGLQLLIATHSPVLIDAAGLSNILLIDKHSKVPRRAHDIDELIPMLSDQGLSLPPSKVMDTLRLRRALFVEGGEKDYEEFIRSFGQLMDPTFTFATRGLNVFEIGEGRKDWPFDAISAFEKLLGGELKFVYVSDRDLLLPDEVQRREARAAREQRTIYHLERRNRECYLIEPTVLGRLLRRKATSRELPTDLRDELSSEAVKQWILAHAREEEDRVRTRLLVENESVMRGDANHRTEATERVNQYFREEYVVPLNQGEIPYRLIDGKRAIKVFRSFVAERYKIHFTDVEVIREFQRSEISEDIRTIVESVKALFPQMPRAREPEPQQQDLFAPADEEGNTMRGDALDGE